MTGRLAWVLVLAVAVPAAAQRRAGSIAGQVTDAQGDPRIGAVVQVIASAVPVLTVFTDSAGHYSIADLRPGSYQLKVSAANYLPSLRPDVNVRAGVRQVVNVTLNTLFEAVQLQRKQSPQDDEDWKWTLRAAANRPILQVLDGSAVVVVSSEKPQDHPLKAKLAFLAGSDAGGFGSASDMTTAFQVERSLFSSGTLSFQGNVSGYDGSTPSTVLRAGYSHRFSDGTNPKIAVTLRRYASPQFAPNNELQALAVSFSNTTNIGDFLGLRYGNEFQALDFMGHLVAFRPFGSADLHLTPNTVLSYAYATSRPTTRMAKGFDTAPADFSETDPRVSLLHSAGEMERARHQEISLSRRVGDISLQAAVYRDHVANTALVGAGSIDSEDLTELLPDAYSGTFTYNGGLLEARGIRLVAERKLIDDLTATVDYAFGGALDVPGMDLQFAALRDGLHMTHRHALGGKITGQAPGSHTRWIASYQWSNGRSLTPVDMFNASPGQTDPFLNVFVRQPLPASGFLPCRVEAMVDIRNLLAQGYIPVLGSDGRTLYLVESPRSVRGGLAFVF
jgi:Carboxypeptidase regulatory-like domain